MRSTLSVQYEHSEIPEISGPNTRGVPVKIRKTQLSLIAIPAALGIVLTGCSNSPDRSAAPAEDVSEEASVTQNESASPDESANSSESDVSKLDGGGNLGTRVCVIRANADTPAMTVDFTRKDSVRGNAKLGPGEQICGEGTFGTGDDVLGKITFDSLKSMDIWGNNPWIGAPGAGVDQTDGKPCAGYEGMSVNQTQVWDDGVLNFTIKRLPDGAWKEFTITVSPSTKPSADRTQAKCTSSGRVPTKL